LPKRINDPPGNGSIDTDPEIPSAIALYTTARKRLANDQDNIGVH
jgi:hypothetical protein